MEEEAGCRRRRWGADADACEETAPAITCSQETAAITITGRRSWRWRRC